MTNDLIERLDTCFKSAKSRWGQDEEYIWIETAYELLGEAIAALRAGAGVELDIDEQSSILSPGGRALARAAEGILRASALSQPTQSGAVDEIMNDEDRIAYWKSAYERMAARNAELCEAGKAILGHMPDYPDNAWQHFEKMMATGGALKGRSE